MTPLQSQVEAYMTENGFVRGRYGDYWILSGSAPQLSFNAVQADFMYLQTVRARMDERENMKFINESTGKETYLPFTQYRYTGDGLLVDWGYREAELNKILAEAKEIA